MRSLVFINSTITSELSPLLQIIYGFELFMSIWTAFLAPAFCYAVFCSKLYHRNIRLYVMSGIVHMFTSNIARLHLIYHQMYLMNDNEDDPMFITANFIRGSVFGYVCAATSALTLDRIIATHFWEWYEKGSLSTLIVFAAAETVADFTGFCAATMYIFNLLPMEVMPIGALFVIATGVSAYLAVYHYNLRHLLGIKKKGAKVHVYSLCRSFQFRENVRIMKVLMKLVGPSMFMNLPLFVFFGLFVFLPKNVAAVHKLRYVSIALFDFWLAMYGILLIIGLIHSEPSWRDKVAAMPAFFGWPARLLRVIHKYLQKKKRKNVSYELRTETELYFSQLSAQLHSKTSF